KIRPPGRRRMVASRGRRSEGSSYAGNFAGRVFCAGVAGRRRCRAGRSRNPFQQGGRVSKFDADVIVVGAGNAAFCAALAAQEQGAGVLMREGAREEEPGGNSRFTAGAIRVVYDGIDDIKALVPDLTAAEIASMDFGTYTAEQFFDDMARVT